MKATHQILIVDGNPNDVKLVREVLESAGLAIHVRTDGISAIEAFHRIKPDLVLIDAHVPETDGVRVSRELKQTDLGRSTPIILMSRRTLKAKERKQALHSSGCALLLQKPVSSKLILETISRFLPNAFSAGSEPESAKTDTFAAPTKSEATQAAPVAQTAHAAQDAQGQDEIPFLDPEAFNEEALGALLDQVFPMSDSGNLAGAIASKSRPSASPGAGTEAGPMAPAAPTGGPAARESKARRPGSSAFNASEESLSALLDGALPDDASSEPAPSLRPPDTSEETTRASVEAERVEDGMASRGSRMAGQVIDAEIVPSPAAAGPAEGTEASTPGSTEASTPGSTDAVEQGDAGALPTSASLTPPEPSASGAPQGAAEVSSSPSDAAAASPATDGPADSARPKPAPSEQEGSTAESVPVAVAPLPAGEPVPTPAAGEVTQGIEIVARPTGEAGPRHDHQGRSKKKWKTGRKESIAQGGAVQSIPLSAPFPASSASPEPEPSPLVAEAPEVIRPVQRPTASDQVVSVETKAPRRTSRALVLFLLLIAAALVGLYFLLTHQSEGDLKPAIEPGRERSMTEVPQTPHPDPIPQSAIGELPAEPSPAPQSATGELPAKPSPILPGHQVSITSKTRRHESRSGAGAGPSKPDAGASPSKPDPSEAKPPSDRSTDSPGDATGNEAGDSQAPAPADPVPTPPPSN